MKPISKAASTSQAASRPHRRSLLHRGALLVGVAGVPAAACSPVEAEVVHALEETLDDHDVPGGAFILRVGGRTRFSVALGAADPETDRSMDLDTRVRIGSITKTLVALSLAELHVAGTVDLDDPVSLWVEGIPEGDAMRIRDLITHQSGLPHYEDVPAYAARQDEPWTEAELLAAVTAEPLVVAPGTAFHYSSTGFLVAGMVLEAATGQPWDGAVRQVLQLDRVAPGIGLPAQGSPLAVGHDDGPIGDSANADNGRGGAALAASAEDLDALFAALQDRSLLSDEAWELALTPHADRGKGLVYGLGINIWPETYGHRGRVLGYAAAWRHRLADDAQLVLTLNASEHSSMYVEADAWEVLEDFGLLD